MAVYALLIGVGRYLHKEIPRLAAPANDVQRMQSYLQTSIPKKELIIKTLVDEQASRMNIITACTELSRQVHPADRVLLYFSGHGVQEKSHPAIMRHTQEDVMEGIVCYDTLAGANCVADKELRYLLYGLSQTGVEIIAILDCCHAGSGTRSTLLAAKRWPQELPVRAWSDFVFADKISIDAVSNAGSLAQVLPEGKHIAFSACSPRQSAWEVAGASVYTSNLLQVIRQSNGGISYFDLHNRVRNLIFNRFDQTPELYVKAGFDTGRLFLGMLSGKQQLTASIFRGEAGWMLDKGAIHGIRLASQMEPVEVLNPETNKLLAKGNITSVMADNSLLHVSDDNLLTKNTYPAIVKGLYQHALHIHVEGEPEGVTLLLEYFKKNRKQLEKQQLFLTDEAAAADYIVQADRRAFYVLRPGANQQRPIVAREIKGYWLQAVESLLAYCTSMSRWEFLKALKNEATAIRPFPIELNIVQYDSGGASRRHTVTEKLVTPYGQCSTGQDCCLSFSFEVKNTGNKDYHVAFIYLSTSFSIEPRMFPAINELIPVGAVKYFREGAKILFKQLPHTILYNHASETCHFLCIVSTLPFDISQVQQAGLPMGGDLANRGGQVLTGNIAMNCTFPVADWATQLYTIELMNPLYKENEPA